MIPPRLEAYLERLRRVPFVRSITVAKHGVKIDHEEVDAILTIKTPTTSERVYCELKTSNMSNALAAQTVALAKKLKPLLVAAPIIGEGTGDFLAAHEVSFVDMRGNCYLDLGSRYVARIQGQRGNRPAPTRGLRVPSYQVLFAVLAESSMISSPLRTLATAAGVSRQPAVTLRERLEDLGHIIRTKAGYRWAPSGKRRALDLWLAGYATTVRPSLLLGSYRTEDTDATKLETRLAHVLNPGTSWRWGGGAAAQRLTGYFRGEKTVVHLAEESPDLPKRLRAVPHRDGPLIMMRSPGPLGLNGATPETAHPLLVYSELLTDGNERAREAAEELAERFAIGKTPS